MKRVLITGASGFIGYCVANHFRKEGYEVVGWDKLDYGGEIRMKSVDMLDEDKVKAELVVDSPDIIVHCAGSADVGKSVKDPAMDYHGNVTITHNLLFSLHKNGLENVRVVFLSSAGVYGNPNILPITEDMQLNPLSPYALHKVMCEELCNYFVNNYGMNIKIARIFSAYGSGLKKQIFWDMYQKQKNSGRLDMFGTGNESRDYIHVNDVVQSIFLMSTKNTEHTIFNIANGEETTIREVTELFAEICSVNRGNISFNGIVREGDPLNWRADNNRIKELGYMKTVDMKKGITDYIEWAKKQ